MNGRTGKRGVSRRVESSRGGGHAESDRGRTKGWDELPAGDVDVPPPAPPPDESSLKNEEEDRLLEAEADKGDTRGRLLLVDARRRATAR